MKRLIPFNKKNREENILTAGSKRAFNMIDDFFDDALNELSLTKRNLLANSFKIDVQETSNEYLIDAELPGVQKEEINLNLNDDGKLTISIDREESVDEKDEDNNYIHKERYYASMERSLYLTDANPDGEVQARLENGLLNIQVPKIEQEPANEGRKIEIE